MRGADATPHDEELTGALLLASFVDDIRAIRLALGIKDG